MNYLTSIALSVAIVAMVSLPAVGQQGPDQLASTVASRTEKLVFTLAELRRTNPSLRGERVEMRRDHADVHFAEQSLTEDALKIIESKLCEASGVSGVDSTLSKSGALLKLRVHYASPMNPPQEAKAQAPSAAWKSSLLLLQLSKELGLERQVAIIPDLLEPNQVSLSLLASVQRSLPEVIGLAEKIENALPEAKVVFIGISNLILADSLTTQTTFSVATQSDARTTAASCIPQLKQSTAALKKLGERHSHIEAYGVRITKSEVTLNLRSGLEDGAWIGDVDTFLKPIPGLQSISLGGIYSNQGNSRISRLRLGFAAGDPDRESETIIRSTLLRTGAQVRDFTSCLPSIKCTLSVREDRMADLTLALLEAKTSLNAQTLEIGKAQRKENQMLNLTVLFRLR